MADAARPTPRAHARTPLSPSSAHNSQWLQVGSMSNMPPRGFFELLNYHRPPRRDHRASPTSFHGAVLWLAGCLVTWSRPWDALVALYDALYTLVGCTETMVIAVAAAVLCMAG